MYNFINSTLQKLTSPVNYKKKKKKKERKENVAFLFCCDWMIDK